MADTNYTEENIRPNVQNQLAPGNFIENEQLLFHAIYFCVQHFYVLQFHLLYFHVSHFHPLRFRWSVIFMSCIFNRPVGELAEN